MKLPLSVDPVIREAFRSLEIDKIKSDGGAKSKKYGEFYDYGGAVYNVKHPEFGAKGNGVTDDTAAIQAAIDAANTAGGGVVHFPPGIYWLSRPLVVPPAATSGQVILKGSGMSLTTLKRTTNTTSGLTSKTAPRTGATDVMDVDAVVIFDHADSTDHARTEIRDLKLDGLGASRNTYGIYAPRLNRSNIQNVFIQNVKDGIFGYQIFATTITNVRAESIDRALVINRDSTGTGGATSLVVNGFSVNNCTYTAYHFENLLYSTFNSCTADDINTNGAATYTDTEDSGTKNAAVWYFDNCRQMVLNGCGNEGTIGPVIYSAGTNSHIIFNGFFTTTEVTGISGSAYLYLDGGYYDFIGCRFGDFSTANGAFNEQYVNGPSVRWINSLRPGGGAAASISNAQTKILEEIDGGINRQSLNTYITDRNGYVAASDGVATNLFTITNPDAVGAYTVKVKVAIRTRTNSSDMAARYEEVVFSRIVPASGSAAISTVVALGPPTQAQSGGAARGVDAPTISVVNTSRTSATVQITITGTGTDDFFVGWQAEVTTARGADADWIPVVS